MAQTKPQQQQKPAPRPQQAIQPQMSAVQMIQNYRKEFEAVIPKHLDPARMLRIAIGAINRSKDLKACTGASVVRSVMEASVMGLEIGVLGEAWMIPFKNHGVLEATLVPGYQGLIKLAVQSGAVAGLNVGWIWSHEEHDVEKGTEPKVIHKPSRVPPKETELPIWYYTAVKMRSGYTQTTVMADWEIDRIKASSPGARSGQSPWNGTQNDKVQMGIKTCIRRALKDVPKTPQLTRALEYEQRRETGVAVAEMLDLPEVGALPGEKDVTPPKGTAEEVADQLAGGSAGAEDDAPTDAELEQAGLLGKDEPGADG